MTLDKKTLEELKAKLLKTEKDLEAELKALGEVPEMGSDVEGEVADEETDEAEEYSGNLGVKDALRGRLQNVKSALREMEDGSYGKCKSCGMDIEPEVLNVDPESRLCKMCKAK
ncbi:MAG: TraR/DksA family transcriptional regulator [Parcubacteria group bacterium Gr01-1014_3]|nr:MAG: TraR/DksA family transcriptional regulator [Parcubacteria group bacterium Gr01-1014_3]